MAARHHISRYTIHTVIIVDIYPVSGSWLIVIVQSPLHTRGNETTPALSQARLHLVAGITHSKTAYLDNKVHSVYLPYIFLFMGHD